MATVYIVGWLFNIVLCFCMGDPTSILNSPMDQPVAQIFYNSLGKVGGLVYASCAVILLQFICLTATQSLARTVFAFSRDRLLPFSNVWAKVNPVTGTPLYAVWFSVFWCIAINLIALGNYAAIEGVFNITAIALDWSYMIPVICKLLFGQFEPGPWHMGKFSFWVNLWGLLWTAFVSVIFFFPTAQPVTAENMNYAIVFMGFILLCACVYWYARGKKFYVGPLKETTIQGEGSNGGILEAVPVENTEHKAQPITA
jgi:amino acid transporter